MKIVFWFILIGCLIGLTGCGRKSVPVSSITTTTNQKDSTTTKTEKITTKDIVRDSLIEKKLPSASIAVTLSKQALDSLILALGTLPKSTTRTIYYTDQTTRAQLAIMLDSLNNIKIKCTSLEKVYYERYVREVHLSETLTNELTKVNKENNTLKETIKELQKTPGQKIKDWFNRMIVKIVIGFFVLLIIVGIVLKVYQKIKTLL